MIFPRTKFVFLPLIKELYDIVTVRNDVITKDAKIARQSEQSKCCGRTHVAPVRKGFY